VSTPSDDKVNCESTLSGKDWINLVTYAPITGYAWLCNATKQQTELSYMTDAIDPSLCSSATDTHFFSIIVSKCVSPPMLSCLEPLTVGEGIACSVDDGSHIRIGSKWDLLKQLDSLEPPTTERLKWIAVGVWIAFMAILLCVCGAVILEDSKQASAAPITSCRILDPHERLVEEMVEEAEAQEDEEEWPAMPRSPRAAEYRGRPTGSLVSKIELPSLRTAPSTAEYLHPEFASRQSPSNSRHALLA
jgi:hypothetical protein